MTYLVLLVLLFGGLDLPIAPPRYGERPEAPAEDEEDPRDTPPPTFYGEEISGETDSLVYVLDISGSMASTGYRPYVDANGKPSQGTRWNRAVAECVRSIRGLSESIKFDIVIYNCGTMVWKPDLVEASAENKAEAEAWLNYINWVSGGTGTGPGTAMGLALRSSALVLLTDGEPNCGAPGTTGHRNMIAAANARGIPIDVFGIEAVGPWRAFCQGVANDSGGRYCDVP